METAEGKWGYLNPDGSYRLDPRWETALNFGDGHAVVYEGGKAGLIDLGCRLAVPCEWDWLGRIGEGFVAAKRDGLYGYVEIGTGRVREPQWEWAEGFWGGFGLVSHQDQWILIRPDGSPAAPPFPRWPGAGE